MYATRDFNWISSSRSAQSSRYQIRLQRYPEQKNTAV
eukprot:CAMPEP_0180401574 /NCGR_PEP_ID=MMETSP0989-20121125/38373_1 /TAXON_ID=697907 /ORGANISM="non described non described, Strain CCMP2293" /LENGTH=36 /DNA_ID= /DNA_START= /DNA_END= /DNA_ORIENTATION=